MQKIAKGTGMIFAGTIISTCLAFVSRLIIVRSSTQSEYGTYSLALVLLNIFVIISLLGLQQGATRYIAYYRGKKEEEKIKSVITSSIKIAVIASVIFSLILFVFSPIISEIFHNPELVLPLRIFSFALFFSVLIHVFTSIFRGFDNVTPKVYFQEFLRNTTFIFLLVVITFLHVNFLEIFYAYTISFFVTCIGLVVYTRKKLPFQFTFKKEFAIKNSMSKKLLFFSLPLLFAALLRMTMQWTDTLMLGYFKSPAMVGLYNAALPLANLIQMGLNSASFIYVPIVSGLYSRELMGEIKRTYQVLTKWIFSATIPLFFIVFLFPATVLNFLFGENYAQAALVLRILSLGFMFHTSLGLNGFSLMVMGRTKFVMLVRLLGAISNIILNAVLIPPFGIAGAATASLLSYSAVNVLCSIRLYQLSKVHPFTSAYIKPVGIVIGLLILIYSFTSPINVTFWMLPLLLSLFMAAYIFLLLLTKSFDQEDIDMLLVIEKKAGINATSLKKILKRFV